MSEETEVKNIEWLKKEIHKELEDWHGVEGGIDGDGINEIMLLINQHEESEVKRLERKIKELESFNDFLIRGNNRLRNELYNQEVLSQEWIDENKKYNGVHDIGYYIPVDKLYGKIVSKQEDMFNGEEPDEGEVYFAVGLEGAVEVNSASNIDEAIERLAEHETSYNILKKPAIPKFIAEAIEEDKERGYDVYDSIDLIIETNGGGLPSLSDWVAINIDKYARAWLNGYMVAEEQKFYVKDKKGNTLLKKVTEGFGIVDRTGEVVNSSDVGEVSDLRLTEQEIKDYDPRYMTFAKPVEELKE